MAQPILRLFGAFQLEVEAGKPVSLPTKKTKALLAYLAFHDNQPHERAKLAALLWADSAETQARESLRQTLSALRRALPGVDAQALVTHADTVTLKSEGLSIDTFEFGRLAKGGAADLDRAAELYRGEFLEGFDLRAPEFETWLLSARRQLNEKAIKALSRLLSLHADAGDVERGVTVATRILSLDPLQEGVHRSLMELHGRQGRFAAALQQYRICSDVLSRQLGVEPEAATTALYREIREQRNRLRDGETGGDRGSARPKSQVEAPGAEGAPPAARPLEKRQITIMACDLFSLEAHASQFDPEDLQPVLDACRKTCVDIMSGFGGLVRKFSGDGMTACFGYPHASEHSAEQAVRAALALVDAIPRLDTALAGQAHVRAGIATGPVLIGELPENADMTNADMTEALVGEAPKLATLLQSLARPGSVVIAQATRALVGDLFDYVLVEAVQSLGLAPAWCVMGERENASRFDARAGSRAMTFVGRERELESLLQRWQSARASGWLELIEGEAGIGKSRLARAFQETIAGEPHQWLHYQCSPFHANSPLHPVVQHIERAARLSAGEAPEQKLDKLEIMLAAPGSGARDAVLCLAVLLSIPVGGRYVPLTLNPAQLRRKILATLLSHVENLARRNPVVMMFEDAHWADASTLEFLALLVERIRQLPVLVLVTYRPGLDVPWSCLDHVGMLSLGGLDDTNVRSIIRDVSRDRHLPPDVVAEIVRKADGIPLFVEELAKTVMEVGAVAAGAGSGTSDPPLLRPMIPASLRDSLTARLDRLAFAREIAQTGAVIGREFSHRLIEKVAGIPSPQLEEGLAVLAESGLINAGGLSAERGYAFKHALVQDAAYETIAKSRRRNLHAAVAQALLNANPDVAETQPEVLAHHYSEAGMTAEALGFWLKSGKFAAGRSAHKEAIAHFDRGLDLLKHGPLAGPDRARWELLFLTAMGPPVMAIHGFGAVESQAVFQRAHDLLDDSTPFPDRLQTLCGLWNIRYHHGEMGAAFPIAQRGLELAQAANAGLDLANSQMGQILSAMGEFAAALGHFQQVFDNYRSGREDPKGRLLVDDHVVALTYTARIRWATGFLERSVEAAQEALALALRLAHPPSVATAHVGRLFLAVHGAPLEHASAQAREAIAYCEEHELVLYQRWTRFLRGALLAQEGDAAAGIEMMEAAVAAAEASGHRLFRPFQLACIATAHASVGNSERGLNMLEDAVSMAEAGGEQQSLATIHRFRGDMLSGLGQHNDAERAFEAALSVARRQGHRIEELRVAMAMVRHAAAPDDAASARGVLEEIYATFEEGHAFPDLQAARDLLNA
jgi:DNA-binding SARP family transcriptional activator/class 3 adenylate cyclase/tetratricopeptide (TPR) repeat protein